MLIPIESKSFSISLRGLSAAKYNDLRLIIVLLSIALLRTILIQLTSVWQNSLNISCDF